MGDLVQVLGKADAQLTGHVCLTLSLLYGLLYLNLLGMLCPIVSDS